jgi:hypothetical protein
MRTTRQAGRRHSVAAVMVAAGLTLTTVIAAAALAGCSGSAPANSSSAASATTAPTAMSSAPADGAEAAAGGVPVAGKAGGGGSAQSASSARLAPSGEQLIYTAQLTVRARSVSAAVSRATAIATGAGGYISSENASSDPDSPNQSTATVELKIPVAVYAQTLSQLSADLGTQLSLQQQAQDVTEEVADVSSRVASDEAAIAQLRALLRHAGSVSDLLTVQDQINSEESDLESLQAEQSALDHETSYATVSVTILGPKTVAKRATHKKAAAAPGFTSGLSGGWHAFRTAVSWFLAIIGAVAPFAALVAVLGWLAYWLRRRALTARNSRNQRAS